MTQRRRCVFCLTLLFAAALARPARASDTTETFDPGATDIELYATADGLGRAAAERAFSADLVLGYGVMERLSAYLGTTLLGDGTLGSGAAQPFLGVYGTPLETDHIDIDLFLGLAVADGSLHVAPAFELNLDSDPTLLGWGLYLRGGVDLSNRRLPAHTHDGEQLLSGLAWSADATLGAYWTVHERHQLLLELDAAFQLAPGPDERAAELGGVALGYNVGVHEAIELITQVWLDLPQEPAEPPALAATAGFIATIP